MEEMDFKEKYEKLREGDITCQENVRHFLSNLENNDENYNIFLQINSNAEEEAKNLDSKLNNGGNPGAFFGICFAIKSNMAVKGYNCSCASKTLENYNAVMDADVVEKIKEEDGIIIGIVNCDEFACGSSGENSAYGETLNPINPSRVPGGSSSGSAASVAAEMCDISLGSDTGGSIRNPASHCGVVGIKPTYGRVSRYGLVDLAMSFDQIGPLSKSVYASALTMEKLMGKSKNDGTTVEASVPSLKEVSRENSYKIGVIKGFEDLIKDKEIKEVFQNKLEELRNEGHQIEEVNIEDINLGIQAYYPIVYTEFFSGTRKFDGIKYGYKIENTAGEEVLRRIYGGEEISKAEYEGAYYKKALKVREKLEKEFKKAFENVDFILSPVTPLLPHKFGEELSTEDMYAYDAFTVPANLANICSGVVPEKRVEKEDGEVPVGIQVMANSYDEETLFKALYLLENSNN